MKKHLTVKDMCEAIVRADVLRNKDGKAPTAREIFEYSPTGELHMVFDWYEQAKIELCCPHKTATMDILQRLLTNGIHIIVNRLRWDDVNRPDLADYLQSISMDAAKLWRALTNKEKISNIDD